MKSAREIDAYAHDPLTARDRFAFSTQSKDALLELYAAELELEAKLWPHDLENTLQSKFYAGIPHTDGCADLLRDFGIVYRPRQAVRPLCNLPISEVGAIPLYAANLRLDFLLLQQCNVLLGGDGLVRSVSHRSGLFLSGHRVVFCPERLVLAELRRLTDYFNQSGKVDPLTSASAILLHLLVVHPFGDANGRLSRLLFQASLSKSKLMRRPMLPLGPFLEKNRAAYLYGLLRFHLTGQTDAFCRIIGKAVSSTAQSVLQILKTRV